MGGLCIALIALGGALLVWAEAVPPRPVPLALGTALVLVGAVGLAFLYWLWPEAL